MVAERTVYEPKGVVEGCPRCDGKVVDYVLPPERLRCLDCGWRQYDVKLTPKTTTGEGRLLRLRYDGARLSYFQLKPLVAVIMPVTEEMRPAHLRLEVLCPICRDDGVEALMRRVRGWRDKWVCGAGHAVRLHRGVGGREFGSWS